MGYDSGHFVAILSLIIHLIQIQNLQFDFLKKFSVINQILGHLIRLNCLVGFFYSISSIFKIQYFILIHLFLSTLISIFDSSLSLDDNKLSDKKKSD
jgi:hypothetical protein